MGGGSPFARKRGIITSTGVVDTKKSFSGASMIKGKEVGEPWHSTSVDCDLC